MSKPRQKEFPIAGSPSVLFGFSITANSLFRLTQNNDLQPAVAVAVRGTSFQFLGNGELRYLSWKVANGIQDTE